MVLENTYATGWVHLQNADGPLPIHNLQAMNFLNHLPFFLLRFLLITSSSAAVLYFVRLIMDDSSSK